MEPVELARGSWRATIADNGMVVSITDGTREWGAAGVHRPLVVEIGGDRFRLTTPRTRQQTVDEVVSTFGLDVSGGVEVRLIQRFIELSGSGAAVSTTVELEPSQPLERDVTVRLPAILSPGDDPVWFAPQKNGVGYVGRGGYRHGKFTWQLGGGVRRGLGEYAVPLGLPLVSLADADSDRRLTWCADAYFTTSFDLEDPDPELNWRYLAAVPMTTVERHTVVACAHSGDERSAIEAFYATALAEIPPGPDWLREIALTHYDYLSERGSGWFRDIDALAEMIPEEDRFRACVCLHGWYDRLGVYAMDSVRRSIRPEWTVDRRPEVSGSGGVTLTVQDVRHMLRYARDRGFRVVLYFGWGLMADSAWARETFEPSAVLRCIGWQEGAEHPALLNPLHPRVRDWYLDYTAALLDTFGDDIDGLVWDDTSVIPIGEIGSPSFPGYTDRAFMTLMRDIAATVHAHRSDIAFLGSDLVGHMYAIDGTGRETAGYSLVADGCWQDSSCNPEAWGYALFPNFRNIAWSCNWWPTRNISYTHYGVWNFGAPAATSNGYGENRGPGDYTRAERAAVMALFYNRPSLPHVMSWLPDGDPRIPGPLGTHILPRLSKDYDGHPLFYPV